MHNRDITQVDQDFPVDARKIFTTPELGHWFTYEEASLVCQRSVKTIKNIVAAKHFPRKWAKGRKRGTHFIMLSAETVSKIRKLTLGF